jgi:hypothetical protein
VIEAFLIVPCAHSQLILIDGLHGGCCVNRRTHMRLGYIEFNEHSWKYRAAKDKGGHFFVRDYEKMEELAQNLEVE